MIDTVEGAAGLLEGRRRILLFTGAGISTESGIPDFRGPNGVWKTADPQDFTLSNYVANSSFRRAAWERRFNSPLRHAKPNAAHRAVADLWELGNMIGCITQNIDGLHQAAGLSETALVELHGNAKGIRCLDCGTIAESDEVEDRWLNGETDPACALCRGTLKSTVIYFGEMLPQQALATAGDWTAEADGVVVVGSSLTVFPAAGIPLEVAAAGAPLVIVNDGRTEYDDYAGALLKGRAGDVLPDLVAMLSR